MSGSRPLRKIFRYRDQSGAPLEAHTEHWRGFTWQAGPVCVIHKDASWGTPQVWAASAAEGKRVITHAAAIAGVDLSQGRWVVTGTLNPRYGRSATMQVRPLVGNTISVTKRDGAGGLPDVVAPLDP